MAANERELIGSDPRARRFLGYPYRVGGDSTPGTANGDEHVRDLILQVLFTNPGERVNLPEFGAGVQRLVFAPNNEALRSSAQFLISANLQRWLGDRLDVNRIDVSSQPGYEESITVEIVYTVKATQQRQSMQVQI